MITELEFKSLASQGYNRIPLMAEAFADLETPLSLYLKLAHSRDGGKHSFLLESVVGGERFGRYSFIGLPARTLLRATGFGAAAKTEVVTDGKVVETATGNPLDFIAAYQQRFKVALRPGLPRFCGGLAGYFGYDTVRHIEKKLENTCPPDTLGCPDILLLQTEELAVIDNLSGKLYLIVYADPSQPEACARAKKRLRELKELLKFSVSAPVIRSSQDFAAEREFAKADYIAAVERAKELIAAGDFMQVQVGQRIRKRYAESPLSLYRALRSLNPSPYMYYYHFGDFHVVG
ncbi:MAG: anthranilate synthase component, partial [Pseudomonadota bacterium]